MANVRILYCNEITAVSFSCTVAFKTIQLHAFPEMLLSLTTEATALLNVTLYHRSSLPVKNQASAFCKILIQKIIRKFFKLQKKDI